MSREVSFFEEGSLKTVMQGFDRAAKAVAGTVGPKGRNVYIDSDMTPRITNDGTSILSNLVFEDKLENAGLYVLKNVSSQQNDDVGDGTTTVAILTQELVHECLKRPESSVEVSRSLKEAGSKVLKLLAKKSNKITKKDVEKVAIISAEDPELARIISEIIGKLGEKAVINVEDSKTFATDYEIVDGYEAPVGFMSPHFVNDKKTGKAVYQDVHVLLIEKKIGNIADISPIFELFKKENITSCVIVCEEIDDSILGILVMNKNMGTFNSLVVRATGDTLRDIEGATGATSLSAANGVGFQNFEVRHLGKAKKVVCDAHKTLFLGSNVSAKLYAQELERAAELEPNMYVQKKMNDRVAQLRGGVAVLKVGAPTDQERGYLKDKAEDAVKATKAALEEGVVAGGGLTFYEIARDMNPKTPGEEVLKRALTAPFRRILENAGKDYAEVVAGLSGQGYDAKKDTYVDMHKTGLVDPAKVERCALENAISAASTFITTFAAITPIPEKDDK